MNPNTALFCLFVSASALGACTASTAPEGQTRSAIHTEEADVGAIAGTWTFDLVASDVAVPIREKCARSSDAATCWNEIAAEAKLEKMRFSVPIEHRSTWHSFAVDGTSEVVFIDAPIDVASDGPARVMAKVAGPATGTQAPMVGAQTTLRIDLVDATTIAMTDPKKGRLVFTKDR